MTKVTANARFRYYHRRKLKAAISTYMELMRTPNPGPAVADLIMRAKQEVLRHEEALRTMQRSSSRYSLTNEQQYMVGDLRAEEEAFAPVQLGDFGVGIMEEAWREKQETDAKLAAMREHAKLDVLTPEQIAEAQASAKRSVEELAARQAEERKARAAAENLALNNIVDLIKVPKLRK